MWVNALHSRHSILSIGRSDTRLMQATEIRCPSKICACWRMYSYPCEGYSVRHSWCLFERRRVIPEQIAADVGLCGFLTGSRATWSFGPGAPRPGRFLAVHWSAPDPVCGPRRSAGRVLALGVLTDSFRSTSPPLRSAHRLAGRHSAILQEVRVGS